MSTGNLGHLGMAAEFRIQGSRSQRKLTILAWEVRV